MFKIKRSELLVLLLTIISISSFCSHSGAATPPLNPFKTNAKLLDYAVKAEQTALSDFPGYVIIPQLDEKEREDIYEYMRLQIKDRIELWQVILLDYARLRLLRNEIYARHRRSFQSQDLDEYFRSFSWYKPDDVSKESSLSVVEEHNVALLQRVELFNYRINERVGKQLIFDMKEGNQTTQKVDEVNGYITVTSDGCCGSTWGGSTIYPYDEKMISSVSGTLRKERAPVFHVSFGYDGGAGSIEYVIPESGNNLVALIIGDIDKGGSSASDNIKNRLVVLDSQGVPLVDIKGIFPLPQGNDAHQLVLLEPDILYISGRIYSSQEQVLFYLKKKIAYEPAGNRGYQWKPLKLEGATGKMDCLEGVRRTPILNPVVLWDKQASGRVISTLVTPDSVVLVTVANNSSYQMAAVDKLTGKQLWVQTIGAGTLAYRDGSLYVITGERLTKFDLSNGKTVWNITANYPRDYGWSPPVLSPGKEHLLVGFGPVLDIYSTVDGALKKRIDQTSDTSKENGIFQSKFHRYWLAGKDSIISYMVASEDHNHVPTKTMSYIVSYNGHGHVLWRFAAPFESSDTSDTVLAVRTIGCEVYVVDDFKVVKLEPTTGKVLFNGRWPKRIDNEDRYARENLVRYFGDKFSWDESMLKKQFTMNADGKSFSETIDPSCTSRVVDDVVYLEDSYYPGSISAAPKCLNGSPDHGQYRENRIWTISPWSGEPKDYTPRIIHVDHNYVLATTGLHYWAIGETALRDYLWRKNGSIYERINRENEKTVQRQKIMKNQDKGTVNKLKNWFGMYGH